MRLAEPGGRDLLDGEAAAPVPGRRAGVLYMITCTCNKAECGSYLFQERGVAFEVAFPGTSNGKLNKC